MTGICFLLALFFSPLIEIVTSAVTTPALVVVGILMAPNFAEINWKKFEVAVPKIYNNYYDATIIFNCDWYRLRIYILSNNYAYHKTQRSTSNYVFLNGTIYFIFRICTRLIGKGRCSIKRHRPFTIYLNDHLCTEYK